MNKIFEDAAVIAYPTFRNDQKEHLQMLRRKSFVDGCMFADVKGLLNWLAQPDCPILLVDGDYYHRSDEDEDGDMPLTEETVYEIFKTQK